MSETRGQRGTEIRAAKERIADVLSTERSDLAGELDSDYAKERMEADELWSLLYPACDILGLDADKVYARCETIAEEIGGQRVNLNFVVTHMRKQMLMAMTNE